MNKMLCVTVVLVVMAAINTVSCRPNNPYDDGMIQPEMNYYEGMDEASSEEEEQANAQFWGIPSIPHIPIPHIPIPIPHIPSIPHIPIPHIPIPGVPIPSIPGLPQIPQIPGIPTTPIPGIPQIPGIPLPGGGSVHLSIIPCYQCRKCKVCPHAFLGMCACAVLR